MPFLKSKPDFSEVGVILFYCKHFLVFYTNFSIKFARQNVNVVIHSLARVTTCYASPHTYQSIPNCNLVIINNEMK
ncbi:hypothetical protein GYH30_000437 [Glycine max]|uniref:Uncharacterized protein n=1 Tax=Glycine max TaxID=3847 RepID=A0A0R0L699_SOYBN|nr:hypothetical protein GYH30_000437 [Glycine max]